MFLLIKRKSVILGAIIILSAYSLLSIFYGIKTAAYGGRSNIIVVDAGHGGVDKGVTGTKTGVKESDLNLKYALLIKEALEKQGFRVILTRVDENGLYEQTWFSSEMSEESRKARDMKKRKEIILNAKPACVISVHMNFFEQSAVRGAQVFYDPLNKQSKEMASSLQARLNILNEEYAKKTVSSLPGDYYIIKCTDYPSCIIECGFLSNKEDEELLLDAAYREKLVYEIINGIIIYLNTVVSGK
ncbi:MAG: N-acetylmuramoyl-L-alanine amidase [Clostridiales bacterium]|jgi:N-acetylmuramoyl-L-alanine amidase|nr:N-acetylmuramoyl-L-alanine amidase [Clostridiales bacterium]